MWAEHGREYVSEELGPCDAFGLGRLEVRARDGAWLAFEVEQGNVGRRGRVRMLRLWSDRAAEMVGVGNDAAVANEVEVGRGNERDELGEERLVAHVDAAGLARQEQANATATARQPLDGILGEGRTQEIATQTLLAFAVTAIDGGRSMLEARLQGDSSAGGETGIDLDVIVGVGTRGEVSMETGTEGALDP